MSSSRQDKFARAMSRQKQAVDQGIAAAQQEQGVVVLLTGDGKGKTSSAFGMVLRALGYGQRVGVVQFIKGTQKSGEELLLQERFPEVVFYQMGTGFTWDTQDHAGDSEAARNTWSHAVQMLSDPAFDLVVLDELTYMLAFKYLSETEVLDVLRQRPASQSVVVTGRGGGSALRALADTVSEVKNIRHAYEAGIKARKGVDY